MITAVKNMTVLLSVMLFFGGGEGSSAESIGAEKGILAYHSYSSYESGDSTVYVYDFAKGERVILPQEGLHHAMNADFGGNPYDLVFMAINTPADKWDIYRHNLFTGKTVNLTENSPYRSEDPKLSPDGYSVVFKEGRWSGEVNDFVYDLFELSLKTGNIRQLTDTAEEESMPCYSPDGETIYYAKGVGENSGIYALDTETLETWVIADEQGIQEYYPIAAEEGLCYARWQSADNPTDAVVRLSEGKTELIPLGDPSQNCSDPFPDGEGGLFYSRTGNGSYDLYRFDGEASQELSAINSDRHELGASYFSPSDCEKALTEANSFILGESADCINADADGDGEINSMDMILLRRAVN